MYKWHFPEFVLMFFEELNLSIVKKIQHELNIFTLGAVQ